MEKFSSFKFKINEQEITLPNAQPDGQVVVHVTAQQPTQQPTEFGTQSFMPSENDDNNGATQSIPDPEPASETVSVSTFFSKLFESRQITHVYHLQVKGDEGSYASHMALNAYYSGILELLDEIIEVYQGQYGIIDKYDTINTDLTETKEKLAYFEEFVTFVRKERACIPAEDTHLHNIVDEMVALLYKTLYKIKYNK